MATIKLNTNLQTVTGNIRARIEKLKDKDYLLRPVCFDLIDLMTKRIHNNGIASDGAPIGTYSKSYLKLRQAKYKRDSDPKTIVSLTRQLENDWSVIATPKGYGIGFLNEFNLKKARYVEHIKDRIIFNLTTEENQYAIDLFNELTNKALND
jgi:hypothetical protein